MRMQYLFPVTCCLLAFVPALQAQQVPFQGFDFGKFKFDQKIPFQVDDLSDQFMIQLLGKPDANQKELQGIQVSIADERKVGEHQFQMYRRYLESEKIQLVSQGRDVIYLRQLVARLHPMMQNTRRYPSIRVHIANASTTDARAFPGGQVVVFRGLLDFVENEAALVGLLGHELSHIDRQHQLEQLKNARLAETKLKNTKVNVNKFFHVGQLMMKSFMTPFGFKQEQEADLDGARWCFQLGYDPLEMAQVFRRLHERDRNRQVPLPGFLRSHPYHIDRFRAIQDERARLLKANPGKDLVTGRRHLKQRQPRP
ncbi:MAG: M48 family metallopeptidase [Pirellulaceae bacterium]|nr:M48 family metallopeptidase [Pirellulaceae bacterium]